MNQQDHYSILGVPRTATAAEIKERFRFLCHAYHPDKFAIDAYRQTAENEFKRINEAYHILSNPTERARFDTSHSYFTEDTMPSSASPSAEESPSPPKKAVKQSSFLRVLLPLPVFFVGAIFGSLISCIPLWILLSSFTGLGFFDILGDIGENGIGTHWILDPFVILILGFAGGAFGYVFALSAASERFHRAAFWQILSSAILATFVTIVVEFQLYDQGQFQIGKAVHAILQEIAIIAGVLFMHIKIQTIEKNKTI